MREWSAVFLLVGAAFSLVAGVGMVRYRDTLSRLHVAGKVTTFGAAGALVGSFLHHGGGWQEVAILAFLLLTTPAGSHALARALARRFHDQSGWPSSEDS
ncbi:MAG: monovalent cation/H(+) antiporter subunit G [Armatimonadota bacterium]|nr:monovalent cation/H(+) antiporter subunit G [Armatimonadota bacterium]MDR7389349.1 monovalent cation/H(+) antiporter subunit G [Armatimonadota bacterium]MDR7393969.1 monovalent cation/H(+) antiporter subunit G [Armatimonadota bacterium]MDR7399696.1 monovalent cation/H(+) antiporter subunit G [Armatimonadota bacterium]MDR7406600.1 monovalent cation/H(+) antiporter subunit G [Armatimonadota bacterium]